MLLAGELVSRVIAFPMGKISENISTITAYTTRH